LSLILNEKYLYCLIFRGLVAEKTDESLFFVDTKQEKSVGKGNLYILHC